MEEETDITEEKQANHRPWLFKKGQSGNPKGRPKGSFSLKTYAKKMLEDMNDKQRQEFLAGLDKKVIWEMAEGKPKQDTDITSDGKAVQSIIYLPAKPKK
jgi:hypothetical protein